MGNDINAEITDGVLYVDGERIGTFTSVSEAPTISFDEKELSVYSRMPTYSSWDASLIFE